MDSAIPVVICFCEPGRHYIRELNVKVGTSIKSLILSSDLYEKFPDLPPLEQLSTGVFGRLRPLDWELCAFDRLEVYRPLLADPKESRRRRVTKKTKVNTKTF